MKIVLETDYRTGLDLVSVIRTEYDRARTDLELLGKATDNNEFMVEQLGLEMERWETLYASTVSALELGEPFQTTLAQWWAVVDARVSVKLASI